MTDPYRIVQRYGRDKAREARISQHATVAAAFAEIDRVSSEMVPTGAPGNAIELIVVGWVRAESCLDQTRTEHWDRAAREASKVPAAVSAEPVSMNDEGVQC